MATENEMKELILQALRESAKITPVDDKMMMSIVFEQQAESIFKLFTEQNTALSNRVRELEGYTDHKKSCPKYWDDDPRPCTCGLDNLLTQP